MKFEFSLLTSGLFLVASASEQRILHAGTTPSRLWLSRPSKHDLFLRFHGNLTQIPSISGNEYNVGEYLESYLRETLDMNTERIYVPPKTSSGPHANDDAVAESEKRRFSVFGYSGKDPKAARVLLTSHIDTVPPFYPYKYIKSEDGRNDSFSGRGSVDAKGSVATQVFALRSLIELEEIQPSDVAVLYVIGEETTGDGMHAASNAFIRKGYDQWKSIIFGEPTEGKLTCGHKGISMLQIKAHGKSAHSGYPWLGVNANSLLVRALAAMEDVAAKKGVEQGGLPYSDKYGYTTINIGRMEGGVAANVIPAEAKARITLRLADGTPKDSIDILWKAALDATEGLTEKGGKLELIDDIPGYSPVDLDCDVEGFETITVNYGTDVRNFQAEGNYTRRLYGPGSILVAHSDHEAGTVQDLEEAVFALRRLILHDLKQ